MAKSEEQFKEIRDQRYEEISNSALRLFAKKGFSGTKINDITSSINLSHGLLYHYFKSKEEIYISVIRSILDQFTRAVHDAEQLSGTAYDKLNWFTELTLAGSAKVALERHLLITEALHAEFLSSTVKEEFVKGYHDALSVLARIIGIGQQEGIFLKGDTMELAAYYLSLSQGLTLWNAKGIYPIRVSSKNVVRPLLAANGMGMVNEF